MNTNNGLIVESSYGDFTLPKEYVTEESNLVIRRSSRDERAVCGKRPVYIGICTCTKSNCDCKIGKKCCQEKKAVVARQGVWQKCIDEVRAYNVQVAKDNAMLPADTGSGSTGAGSGAGSAETDTSSGAGTGAAGAATGSGSGAKEDTGSGAGSAGGESWMKKNQKMLIFGALILVALIVVFVLFAGKKSATNN
jgi:hypothetical protein